MVAPAIDVRVGNIVLRKQPPVVVHYCDPPTSTKAVRQDCVYDNVACTAGSSRCPECHFPFCDNHFPKHRRRREVPVDVWKQFLVNLNRWREVVGKNPKARPRVAFRIPEPGHGQA